MLFLLFKHTILDLVDISLLQGSPRVFRSHIFTDRFIFNLLASFAWSLQPEFCTTGFVMIQVLAKKNGKTHQCFDGKIHGFLQQIVHQLDESWRRQGHRCGQRCSEAWRDWLCDSLKDRGRWEMSVTFVGLQGGWLKVVNWEALWYYIMK